MKLIYYIEILATQEILFFRNYENAQAMFLELIEQGYPYFTLKFGCKNI